MKKISIIMPVYNAEAFLRRAIDSIITQTLQEWELICIDDGSKDASGQILDEYAAQDKRIRVMHQSNSGVAMARQIGVDAATGEYIIHTDSDDWVEPTMLEELYHKAKKEDADVVVCDYYVNNQIGQRLIKQQPTQLTSTQMLHDLFHRLHGSLCNKLLRRVCYTRYGLKFYEGINYCEDVLIWAQLLKHEDVKVSYFSQAFYHYCDNRLSITRHYTRQTYAVRQKYQQKLEGILTDMDFEKEVHKSAFDIYTEAFIYDVLTNDEIREGLQQYKRQIKELKTLRWRIGFAFLYLGFNHLAHQFIHF